MAFKKVLTKAGEEINISGNSVLCDPDKLKTLFTMRNISSREASAAMGFNPDAVNKALARGCLSGFMAAGLEKMFNIKPQDYEYIPPQPEPEPVQEQQADTPVQENELYLVMRTAFADALNDFFQNKDNKKVMLGMIYAAIVRANNGGTGNGEQH